MNTDKIKINSQFLKLENIQDKLNDSSLQNWEKGIYVFILNWFDQSDYILQKTSGSTGTPKEIKLKKSAMLASASNTFNFFQLQKNDTAWLCLPIEYIAGKMMVVRAIVGELNLLFSNPKGSPEIPEMQVDFTALVPLQLQKLVDNKADFSKFKSIIIGGAAVDYTLQKALQNLPAAIYATYGMTETCSHIALQKLNGKNPDPYFKVLNEIEISTNTEGCLKIEAPTLSENIIQTTDLVEIISSKEFMWLGRTDNIINSGGLKISPEFIEKEISKIIGTECIIVPEKDALLGQKLVLILQGKSNKILSEKILQKIKSELGKHHTPKFVYYLDEFPRNKSLKIDRKKAIKILNINQ